MNDIWPWLLLAGLGAFHGLNPAMGWLFAVALGVHRKSSMVVMQAVPVIALGHALSIVVVGGAVVATGFFVDERAVQAGAGCALVAWAVWHWLFGHRRRVLIGMRTGMAGLALWSFLMATAHGAGLMILPAFIPLCLTQSPMADIGGGSAMMAIAAVGVHSFAMLAATGLMAILFYRWVGLEILRRAWLNVDLIWTPLLLGTGGLLLLS